MNQITKYAFRQYQYVTDDDILVDVLSFLNHQPEGYQRNDWDHVRQDNMKTKLFHIKQDLGKTNIES